MEQSLLVGVRVFILIFCIHFYMLKIFGSNTVEASPFSLKSLCKGMKSSPPPLPLFYLQGLRHTRVTVSAQGRGAAGSRGGTLYQREIPFAVY